MAISEDSTIIFAYSGQKTLIGQGLQQCDWTIVKSDCHGWCPITIRTIMRSDPLRGFVVSQSTQKAISESISNRRTLGGRGCGSRDERWQHSASKSMKRTVQSRCWGCRGYLPTLNLGRQTPFLVQRFTVITCSTQNIKQIDVDAREKYATDLGANR